jgi:hypothetical protein
MLDEMGLAKQGRVSRGRARLFSDEALHLVAPAGFALCPGVRRACCRACQAGCFLKCWAEDSHCGKLSSMLHRRTPQEGACFWKY